MTLQILLATFNGERWLPDQLTSIVDQIWEDWHLLVSDDGSSDATQRLLDRVANGDPRIELMPPVQNEQLGAAGNFARLLEHRRFPAPTRIFLADQDDFWYPQKLDRLSGLLNKNVLAFSDARLIDSNGECLGTLFETLGVEAEVSLPDVLAANAAAGCTMAFRAELLDVALPIPASVVNHDWWLLVCALCVGPVAIYREPLMDYRQHGANAVGAAGGFSRLSQLPKLLRRQRSVLLGKPLAIRELVLRLEAERRPVPDALIGYLAKFEGTSAGWQALNLIFGHFAPRSWSLRMLQVFALILPVQARTRR